MGLVMPHTLLWDGIQVPEFIFVMCYINKNPKKHEPNSQILLSNATLQ